MNDSEIRAFLTIALMAALADGSKDDRERAALKNLAARLCLARKRAPTR
jgi:tellurite resistance protein